MFTSFDLSLPSLLLLLLSGPLSSTSHHLDAARVRPLSPVLDQALVSAYEQSPTIRRLIAELDDSDVIVHFISRTTVTGPAGALRLVTFAGDTRFLRVTIDLALPPNARAGILGHELQHAVEIARAPWVRDQDSFAELFQEIGYASGGQLPARRSFETAAAREVEAQVLDELRLWRHATERE